MKNVLNYYYNINPENLIQVGENNYSFYLDYHKFYLLKLTRPKDDLDELVKVFQNKSKYFHRIIMNKFGLISTKVEKEEYVLLKIVGTENEEVTITDILNSRIVIEGNTILNRNTWGVLWERKTDYLEYQVSELATNYKVIHRSFSYYVGLAENAIEYFNMLNTNGGVLTISRRRVRYPLYIRDYNDPLELVVDYSVRDIAEYIKSKFFEGEDVLQDIDILIDKDVLSSLEYNLLFSRLLYPSYYFDQMQFVLEKEADEDSLLKYIESCNDYERILRLVWLKFSKKCPMIKIDWLIEK